MGSVVLELQREALERGVCVADLLRKALLVAKKLKVIEFENWTTSELNGYQNAKEVPDYRVIFGEVKGYNVIRQEWQPVFFSVNETEELFSERRNVQSIAEIEGLIEKSSSKNTFVHFPFPAEGKAHLMKVTGAKIEFTLFVDRSALIRIIDSVRTIVLQWTLKLEEDGIVGEGMSFTPAEKETAKTTSYNVNNFYAPVQSPQIQQQSSDSVQISNVQTIDLDIVKQFLTALREQYAQLNLDPVIQQELESEIKTVEAQVESPKPKENIVKQCLGAIQRILESAGGGVAGQLLLELGKILGGGG